MREQSVQLHINLSWCRPGVVHLLYNEYCSNVHLTHLFVMLHAGPKTNILPHLPLVGDLRKLTGHKYFLQTMKCLCTVCTVYMYLFIYLFISFIYLPKLVFTHIWSLDIVNVRPCVPIYIIRIHWDYCTKLTSLAAFSWNSFISVCLSHVDLFVICLS